MPKRIEYTLIPCPLLGPHPYSVGQKAFAWIVYLLDFHCPQADMRRNSVGRLLRTSMSARQISCRAREDPPVWGQFYPGVMGFWIAASLPMRYSTNRAVHIVKDT